MQKDFKLFVIYVIILHLIALFICHATEAQTIYDRMKTRSETYTELHNTEIIVDLIMVKSQGELEILVNHHMKWAYKTEEDKCTEHLVVDVRSLSEKDRTRVAEDINHIPGYSAELYFGKLMELKKELCHE